MMKWIILAGFLACLVRFSEGGALKCAPGVQDSPCRTQKEEKDAPVQISKEVENKTKTVVVAECLAGSEWESNCHSCKCSEAGIAECTKQDKCNGVLGEPIRCKPNTSFQRDCNTCICLENGLGICTLQLCEHPSTSNRLVAGKECAPDTHWKSRCNDCVCSPEGFPFCTDKACPNQDSEAEMLCAPETAWKNDCNTCWCTDRGLAMCTKMGCMGITNMTFNDEFALSSDENTTPNVKEPLSRKRRAPPQEPPKTCEPGKVFRVDCNQCLCDNEGQDFSCTRIDCIALNNINNGGSRRKRDIEFDEPTQNVTTDCTPASLYEQGCNVCRCMLDGHHAICTKRQCTVANKEINRQPKTVDVIPTSPDPNFRCNPGEQFKRNCNDCTCAADGKDVFCTLRLCDKDISRVI